MKKSIIILFVFSLSCFADDFSPQEVMSDIEQYGLKFTVKYYYEDDGKRHEFLNHIIDGNDQWITVAVKILQGTDASWTTDTYDALAWALWREPKNVLPYVEDYRLPVHVCEPNLWEDDSITPHYLALLSAISKLEQLEASDVKRSRKQCLEQLYRSKVFLEKSLNKQSLRTQ